MHFSINLYLSKLKKFDFRIKQSELNLEDHRIGIFFNDDVNKGFLLIYLLPLLVNSIQIA